MHFGGGGVVVALKSWKHDGAKDASQLVKVTPIVVLQTKIAERKKSKLRVWLVCHKTQKGVDIMAPSQLSEAELRAYKDELYEKAKKGEKNFTGLLEVIACRENIIHAIRKVKSNAGFKTAGTDNMTGEELLQLDTQEVFDLIQKQLENYEPNNVKRVLIPKRNGKKRPLGIPTVVDRVIQTAITNILEPILEAQFYEHSYGFRPMRQVEHAIAYISVLINSDEKRYWIVEGDIKLYFDTVRHATLIKKLYKYGIRDKRVIALVKKVLKAGIEGEKQENDIGTPQGGSLSPLLANLYLTDFDKWVDAQWRSFNTEKQYATQAGKIRALKSTNLKQGYLVRYADDWIILTDSEESAIKWKRAAKKFLNDKLQIELSEEKTKITDIRKQDVSFLGISMRAVKSAKDKYTLRTRPDPDKLNAKMKDVYEALKDIRHANCEADLVEEITRYNAIARGLNNYYRITTLYSSVLDKEEWKMRKALMATMRKQRGQRVKYSECANLRYNRKKNYKGTTVAFKVADHQHYFGLEKLGVGSYQKPKIKAQWITPYGAKGRLKYEEITGNRWETIVRNPMLTLGNISSLIAKSSKESRIYNLEYFINRAMVYNRDKGKCRCCKKALTGNGDVEIHHKNKTLELNKINKLNNLVTYCPQCHKRVHKIAKSVAEKQTDKEQSRRVKNKTAPESRSAVKPSKELLEEQISTMPMTVVGKLYGVSDNAVRKWAKSYGIYDKRLIKLKSAKTNAI